MKEVIGIFMKFTAAFVILIASGAFIDKAGLITYFIAVPLFAVPVILNACARYGLKKELTLLEYEKTKFLYRLLSGKAIGYTVIIISSIAIGFIAPVRIYTFSGTEKLCLTAIFPLYILSNAVSKKIIRSVYNDKFAPYKTERLTYMITSLLSAVTFPLLANALKDVNIMIPFADGSAESLKNNYAAYFIANILSISDNAARTVLNSDLVSSAPKWFFLTLLIILGGGGIFFYALINFIGFFFIKKENLKKIFQPAEPDNNEIKINKFLSAFIITVLTVFIYPSVFAAVTYIAMSKQYLAENAVKANAVAVEVINGVMYKAGTLNSIKIAKDKAYGAAKEEVIKSVNETYDAMMANTDNYLDWYYSLSAEYTRLLKLITGSIEEYMKDTLQEKLTENIEFNIDFDAVTANAEKLKDDINDILDINKITDKNALYDITADIKADNIYELAQIEPMMDFKKRLAASTGGAIAAGAIAGTIAAKAAAKTGFKTAAKAAAKAAAGKAVSAAAGAAAGAVSSVVTSPLGGAAIGTATGLAIDKSLLKLEEAVNRNKYKQEITDSIEESRKNMIDIIEKSFENN